MKIFWAILISFSLLYAKNGNVLIVEKPEALHLLNVYRQPLNTAEKQALGRYVPFWLQETLTLADGVTQAYRVRLLNKTFYLLLDGQGQPLNLQAAGFHRQFKQVRVLLDTVQLRSGQHLTLLNVQNETPIKTLSAGQPIIRVFRFAGLYYVALEQPFPLFGVIKNPPPGIWQKTNVRLQTLSQKLNRLWQEIQFFVQNKNQLYRKLYLYLKPQAQEQEIPQWQTKRTANAIFLNFSRPDLLPRLNHSTRLFFNELTRLVEAYNFYIAKGQTAGNWQIKPRGQK